MKQLTVKEAIEQGYTRWSYQGREDSGIFDLERDRIDADNAFLVEKTPSFASVNGDDLANDIWQDVDCNMEAEDMEGQFEEAVKSAVDWEEIAIKINEQLAKIPIYYLTEIKVVS